MMALMEAIWYLFITTMILHRAVALQTKMEQLDGQQQSNSLDIPYITGPFYVEITAIIFAHDDWKRFFDFHIIDATGDSTCHIGLYTRNSPGEITFQYKDDSNNNNEVGVSNAVTYGTKDVWRVGVDASGLMTLHKNGSLLKSEPGVNIPTDGLIRNEQNLGHVGNGNQPLEGTILGFKVQNLSDPKVPVYRSLSNFPAQVFSGVFVASLYARFDDTDRSSQRLFEFGNDPNNDQISFGQSGQGQDIALEVKQNGTTKTCIAPGAINEDDLDFWAVEMSGATWYIAKNGYVIKTCTGMAAPVSTFRKKLRFGESGSSGDRLDGVVLGFRLDDNFVPEFRRFPPLPP